MASHRGHLLNLDPYLTNKYFHFHTYHSLPNVILETPMVILILCHPFMVISNESMVKSNKSTKSRLSRYITVFIKTSALLSVNFFTKFFIQWYYFLDSKNKALTLNTTTFVSYDNCRRRLKLQFSRCMYKYVQHQRTERNVTYLFSKLTKIS